MAWCTSFGSRASIIRSTSRSICSSALNACLNKSSLGINETVWRKGVRRDMICGTSVLQASYKESIVPSEIVD